MKELFENYPILTTISTFLITIIAFWINHRVKEINEIKRKLNSIYFQYETFETLSSIIKIIVDLNLINTVNGIKNDVDMLPDSIKDINFFSKIEYRKSKILCGEYEKVINLKLLIYHLRDYHNKINPEKIIYKCRTISNQEEKEKLCKYYFNMSFDELFNLYHDNKKHVLVEKMEEKENLQCCITNAELFHNKLDIKYLNYMFTFKVFFSFLRIKKSFDVKYRKLTSYY